MRKVEEVFAFESVLKIQLATGYNFRTIELQKSNEVIECPYLSRRYRKYIELNKKRREEEIKNNNKRTKEKQKNGRFLKKLINSKIILKIKFSTRNIQQARSTS